MLEDSLLESQYRRKSGKPATVTVSVIAHIVAVVILIVVPLIQIQAITIPPIDQSLLAPKFDRLRPIDVFVVKPRIQKVIADTEPNVLTALESIPRGIAYVDEPKVPDVGFVPSLSGSDIRDLLRNMIDPAIEPARPTDPGPPPPPPPTPVVKAEPIRQGGVVQAANLIYQVKPEYPPLARAARIQGVVVMEAVISREGSIETLRVVSGHPLLNQAALDAVKQWKYRPTLLNGEPVEVITTVTVMFSFQ